jgi:hypothetical protein
MLVAMNTISPLQKTPTHLLDGGARGKPGFAPGTGGRWSCCLFVLIDGANCFEHIRPGELQIHKAGGRDAILAPLGNRAWADFTQHGSGTGTADSVDDGVCVDVHGDI